MNTWEMFEALTDQLGTEEMLTAIAQSMSTDELQKTCDYIARMYDVDFEDEDEDEE